MGHADFLRCAKRIDGGAAGPTAVAAEPPAAAGPDATSGLDLTAAHGGARGRATIFPPASTVNPNVYVVPREIPRRTDVGPDTAQPDAEAPCTQCVGIDKTAVGVPSNIPIIGVAVPPPLPKPVAPPQGVSRMMDGLLIHRVQPDYPPLAKQARVQGPVEIAAVISKQGTIENLQVITGNPMLIPNALSAVRQWRYRPYILNGDPIEVDTRITVTFVLGN